MERNTENVIEWLEGQDTATVTCSSRFKSKIKKLAERFPEEVKVIAENRDNTIMAHVPLSWVNIRRPRQIAEESKAALYERLQSMRTKRAEKRGECT